LQKLLQEMVEIHGDRIYRLALRYTGDRAQAQDLTQETFLRAYKHLDSYDRSMPAGPWLCKIAGNLCLNWLRDNRESPVSLNEDMSAGSDPGPEARYLQKEQEKDLHQALHQLPIIYREVVLLKHVAELSYAEICEALDLELSLVKNRLYRGRMMLRESLQKGAEN
jgi:RNA polymerase sigma-70 factor (ECF subfamily)